MGKLEKIGLSTATLIGREKESSCNIWVGVALIACAFFFVPFASQASTDTQDFDDEGAGANIATFGWSAQTGSGGLQAAVSTATTSVSAPYSLYKSPVTASGGIKNTFASSEEGIASVWVNTFTDANFESSIFSVLSTSSSDYSEIQLVFSQRSGDDLVECGSNSPETIGVWTRGVWYEALLEWRQTAGETEGRCGFRASGSPIAWSDWRGTGGAYGTVGGVKVYSNQAYPHLAIDNYFYATDADYEALGLDDTRVIEVTPYSREESTTATSTAMSTSITGYVSEEDFVEGMTARLSVFRLSSTQQVSKVMAWETIQAGAPHSYALEWEITSSGDFYFSTTTDTSDFLEGAYSIVGEIVIPATTDTFLSSVWQAFMDALTKANGTEPAESPIRMVDRFIIGAPTWYDELVEDVTQSRDLALLSLESCNPLDESFSIKDCLFLLLLPTEQGFADLWDTAYSEIFTKAPLGYITRFVEIITLGEATMPPALTYTYGTSAPEELQGKSVMFQIFDTENISLITSIESDSLVDPKNIWEITAPYFNAIVGLAVLGVILKDLMAIGIPDFTNSPSSRGRVNARMDTSDIDNMKITDHSRLTDEEWENHKRNRLI